MAAAFCITYISPNGSTRKVAQAIADQLSAAGATVTVVDLAEPQASRRLVETIAADGPSCLFIGSPVYNDMAVPPVMAVIDAIPPSSRGWAVPFVTYGRACSGVALWQMATALRDKGLHVAGAAKVVAVHSLMWRSQHPVGEGRPDDGDLQQVRRLAEVLERQLRAGSLRPLDVATLDYQPPELASRLKDRLGQPWMNIPRSVDAHACTECGDCAAGCPVGAVSLTPLPEFGDGCFDCFNCIRLCPEDAIKPAIPITSIEEMIRERVRRIDEQPLTQVFVARQ